MIVSVRTTRREGPNGESVVRNESTTYPDGYNRPPSVEAVEIDSCSECREGFRFGSPLAYFLYGGEEGTAHLRCVPEGSDIQATV